MTRCYGAEETEHSKQKGKAGVMASARVDQREDIFWGQPVFMVRIGSLVWAKQTITGLGSDFNQIWK